MDVFGDEISVETENFHNFIREIIIFFLSFVILLTLSHLIIRYFKEKPENDYAWIDKDDRKVYQVTLAICVFSLAVTFAGVLLLPFSIVSNEVLLFYPKSYYIQWLNSSLVKGLWNSVSLCSNATFFILVPFAYLFLDSQGFAGTRGTIWSRVLEAICCLLLVMIAVFGVAWVIAAPFAPVQESQGGWSRITASLWSLWRVYLPLVHSGVSFLGVVLLLVCCPVGLLRLVGFFVGRLSSWRPQFRSRQSAVELMTAARFEEASLAMKVSSGNVANGWHFAVHSEEATRFEYAEAIRRRNDLEHRARYWYLPVLYAVGILVSLAMGGLALAYTAVNLLGLVVGLRSIPGEQGDVDLGLKSMSSLGWAGAAVQILLIMFLQVTSLVGAYSLPPMKFLQPHVRHTTLSQLLGNCSCLLLLSSAIPVQSRILGISNFNLLGSFGRLDWLGNVVLVLLYNAVFLVAHALYVAKRFRSMTVDSWHELIGWFKETLTLVVRRREGSVTKVD